MIVHFLDTSVFCNILNIDGRNERAGEAMAELQRICADKDREIIVLPFATVIETGNHIAHISDGNLRYKTAQKFCEAMNKTVSGEAPWTYYGSQLTEEDLMKICAGFPEAAQNKVGFGDLSIIRAYEKYKDEIPGIGEIRIWSYDKHLAAYHERMELPERRR